MKVILCEDHDNLGNMGDTVIVAAGYARNFLLPRKLAVLADSASAKQLDHEMRIIRGREEKKRAALGGVKDALAGTTLEFTAKAGEEGKLFGSITSHHIADRLIEMGHSVDRRKVTLTEPLKSVGEYEVSVRLGREIDATIKVRIVAEEVQEVEEVAEAPVVIDETQLIPDKED